MEQDVYLSYGHWVEVENGIQVTKVLRDIMGQRLALKMLSSKYNEEEKTRFPYNFLRDILALCKGFDEKSKRKLKISIKFRKTSE